MEKLTMCRICLVEESGMQLLSNSYLKKTYEKLTDMPFETEDGRPVKVCYICFARLKNCYHLRKTCLRSEELLTQVLNGEMINIQECHNAKTLTITHTVLHLSMVGGVSCNGNANCDSIMKDPDLFVDVKVEHESGEDNIILQDEEIMPDLYLEHDKISHEIQKDGTQNTSELTHDLQSEKTQELGVIKTIEVQITDETQILQDEEIMPDLYLEPDEISHEIQKDGTQNTSELTHDLRSDETQELDVIISNKIQNTDETQILQDEEIMPDLYLEPDEISHEIQKDGTQNTSELTHDLRSDETQELDVIISNKIQNTDETQILQDEEIMPDLYLEPDEISHEIQKDGTQNTSELSHDLQSEETQELEMILTNEIKNTSNKSNELQNDENENTSPSTYLKQIDESQETEIGLSKNIQNDGLGRNKNTSDLIYVIEILESQEIIAHEIQNCGNLKTSPSTHDIKNKSTKEKQSNNRTQNPVILQTDEKNNGMRNGGVKKTRKLTKIQNIGQKDIAGTSQRVKNICPKMLKVVLERMDLNDIRKGIQVTEKYSLLRSRNTRSNRSTITSTIIKTDSKEKNTKIKSEEPEKIALQKETILRKRKTHSNKNKENLKINSKIMIKKNRNKIKMEKRFHCTVCDKYFRQKISLQKHSFIHSGLRPFVCDVCNKTFNNMDNLKQHILIHTGEKPHKCEICNTFFRQRSALRAHIRIHTGIKPYTCKICQKSFARKNCLDKHLVMHSNKRPFICEVCAKDFNYYDNLVLHLRLHTNEKPYQCNVCSKRFTHKFTLHMHSRIHTDDKPYKCDVCKRYFRNNENLLRHFSKHAPNKPFRCETCRRYFIIEANYLKHVRSHTNRYYTKKALALATKK